MDNFNRIQLFHNHHCDHYKWLDKQIPLHSHYWTNIISQASIQTWQILWSTSQSQNENCHETYAEQWNFQNETAAKRFMHQTPVKDEQIVIS